MWDWFEFGDSEVTEFTEAGWDWVGMIAQVGRCYVCFPDVFSEVWLQAAGYVCPRLQSADVAVALVKGERAFVGGQSSVMYGCGVELHVPTTADPGVTLSGPLRTRPLLAARMHSLPLSAESAPKAPRAALSL